MCLQHVLHLELVGDLLNMECQVQQPVRVGIGFSYEEIREKCNQVVHDEQMKNIDSAGHIVNVDDEKRVTFGPLRPAPPKPQKKSIKRRKARSSVPRTDDSEVLRQKMSSISSGTFRRGKFVVFEC